MDFITVKTGIYSCQFNIDLQCKVALMAYGFHFNTSEFPIYRLYIWITLILQDNMFNLDFHQFIVIWSTRSETISALIKHLFGIDNKSGKAKKSGWIFPHRIRNTEIFHCPITFSPLGAKLLNLYIQWSSRFFLNSSVPRKSGFRLITSKILGISM